jgi:hypothetical protein
MLSGFFQKKPILCINAKVLTVKDGYILSWQATEQHKKSLSSCLQVVCLWGLCHAQTMCGIQLLHTGNLSADKSYY